MILTENFFTLSATDLSNHLACRHLTALNKLLAKEEIDEPGWYDPSLQILIERGQEHEAAYVEYLKDKGLKVANLKGKPMGAAVAAMAEGVDVIVQATLNEKPWTGIADILMKVPGKSNFGHWSYEVHDTKLSQNTRASTILQLCLYTELISFILGWPPENMYVVHPGTEFPKEQYRFAEFQAYYRAVKNSFQSVMATPVQNTYPDPTEQCSICRWWQVCENKRRADDHLSLVAGIRSLQINVLQDQGITTLQQLAIAPEIKKNKRGNYETLIRKQSQAKIQLDGRVSNTMLYKILPIETERGLNRLPEPNDGDIYLDIEGDNFYPDGGIEYLIGYTYRENNRLVYKKIWASTRSEEKIAFQSLMEFISIRRKQFPKLYIYHFAPYETSAIKRMSRVHALFEKDLDELLRESRFVDLHAAFKEALLASVEVYSLKELEKFTRYTRLVDLHDASAARKTVELALELKNFKAIPGETLRTVEAYNQDDCLATEALHHWLESIRVSLEKEGQRFHRPVAEPEEMSEELRGNERRSQSLYEYLIMQLPDERVTDEHKAKWLLAHQLDYFRREDKSAWWEYFRLHSLQYEDQLDERKAIGALQFIQELPGKAGNIPTHRYSYPAQEVGLKEGDKLHEVNGKQIGTVVEVHLENNTIDIKKTKETIQLHPVAVHVYDRIGPGSLWTSIMNFAEAVYEDGLDHKGSYHAAKDLLMNRNPRLKDGTDGAEILKGESTADAAIRIALNLDRSILPIQGPPGAGKTYTGAKMIMELAKAKKKVGVTAISHRVITTLFEKVKELADKEQTEIQFAHKISNSKLDYMPDWISQIKDTKKILAALDKGTVVGGTAWLWSSGDMRDSVDYLFIDEAGQMSLSQALAACAGARNIVLLGDPQQLEQPQKGAHPEGSDIAALTYLLGGKPTMPERKGLFLSTTHRIHPAITKFTSEIFYEGKLSALPSLENQRIDGGTSFDGSGLFYVPVDHNSNQNRSLEEVEAISAIVKNLIEKGQWTDDKKEKRKLTNQDILIVAPYNAQVNALIEAMPGMRIGTVDKFQGQEAPVVIYSLTSSSHEEAPRGMSFLYNPNRLNVATSRAKAICILVATPRLMEPHCRTIDQMKWANALCRYKELAQTVAL